MDREKVNLLLRNYLDSMHTLPPPDIHLMTILTLKELRSRARTTEGKKLSQAALGAMLERDRMTIVQWEAGRGLDGITTSHLVIMANAFGCRIEELVAVIENTRKLSKDKNQ